MTIFSKNERNKKSIGAIVGSISLGLSLVVFLASCTLPSLFPAQNSSQCLNTIAQPVTLTMYYSSEKQAWIEDGVKAFNQQQASCSHPISVKATAMGSGQSMQRILNGEKPDIWSPASGTWLSLLNQMWQEKHPDTTDKQYCLHPDCQLISMGATDTPSLVLSPLVIAMWKPQAEALGWPQKALGWADIAALSTSAQGWAAYGHPEWGNFKLGHTTPDNSNGGIDALIAEYYTAVGKTHGLTVADIHSTQAQDFVTNVESSITHYEDSSEALANNMFTQGPGYLDAAITYEGLVIQANQRPHLPFPVVAIYPKEGTFYSDHPFAILQAGWVSSAKKAAALMFRTFLLAPDQQKKALSYGFRPISSAIKLTAPLDSNHGVDPRQPMSILPVPDQDVVNAILVAWHKLYRRVDVQLLVDRSGSMNDSLGDISKIKAVKRDILALLNAISGSDYVGLNTFSTQEATLVPLSVLHAQRQAIINKVNAIHPSGHTRLYNSIADDVKRLEALPHRYPRVLIVLTDGEDTVHLLSLDQLISQLSSTDAHQKIKIFTLACSNIDADRALLTHIAQATGGQEYNGSIASVQQIATFLNQPLDTP